MVSNGTYEKSPEIVVVIPTLNEEAGVGWVLDRVHETLRKHGKKYHIVVVDGGSQDKTVEIARNRGAEVIMQNGRGYGDAYIQGFNYSIRKYKPKIIVMLDADGTYDPAEIPKLIKPIEQNEADMVVGNRFAKLQPGAMSTLNKIGNKILSWLARLMIGVGIRDTQSGYRAMSRELLETIPLTHKGMPFATELIVEAYAYGYRIKEQPITYKPRLGGQPKLNPLQDGYRILKTIIQFALRYNPTFFAFTLGALLLIPGLTLGTYVAYHYFFTGIKYYVKGLVAIITTLIGFQSLLLAILTLYLKRMEYRLLRLIYTSRQAKRQ